MTDTKKIFPNPVSVTGVIPVYINGRIKYYNVHVEYDGDLSLNTKQREDCLAFANKEPAAFFSDPMNERMLTPVINPNVVIPNVSHCTSFFKYHHEKNTSELEYSWRRGLFNGGAERAWQFRIQMLTKIDKNIVNENTK